MIIHLTKVENCLRLRTGSQLHVRPRPSGSKRPESDRVTIAIGMNFRDGVALCADSKVVASDGATTSGFKLDISFGSKKRLMAIANAAEDGRAATMLSEKLAAAVGGTKSDLVSDVEKNVVRVMTEWHNSYGLQKPPFLQFIIATTSAVDGSSAIYLCEPPATFWECTDPLAIGRGARAVEPFLGFPHGLMKPSESLQTTLLRMAFLMYRAKSEEGSACGGETHAVGLMTTGQLCNISARDMATAENLAEELDHLLMKIARMATSGSAEEENLAELRNEYKAMAEKARDFKFPNSIVMDIMGMKADGLIAHKAGLP